MPNNQILTTFATSTNVLARIRNVGISWATFSMSAFAQGFASTVAQVVSSSDLFNKRYFSQLYVMLIIVLPCNFTN